jgi:hypothetical protein
MSGYNSEREVREVIVATLKMEGRDPADYNVSKILRGAFYHRGLGYGYGALGEDEWRKAVSAAKKKRAR